MVDKAQLSSIGIGTWGVGGYMERDSSVNQDQQINAIVYQLKNGLNIVQANDIYSQGLAVELLGKAISKSKVSRDKLFIIQANYKDKSNFDFVEKEIDHVMKTLNTDYIDTFQFRSKAFFENDFDDLCKTIDVLLSKKKILKTSITNAGLDLLKKYHQRFGDSLFSIEIGHNFEIRENEKAGIIKYAKDNSIEVFVYQPLRRNRTAQHHWPLLVSLADKYNVTQNQIILAWLISKSFFVLTKSENLQHIDEALAATKLVLDPQDITEIDEFSPPHYSSPTTDWEWTGNGVTVDQLSNVFDDDYVRQQAGE